MTKKRGRPSKGTETLTESVHVRLTAADAAGVDRVRGTKSRAEVIRSMVRAGLSREHVPDVTWEFT